ncbi:MAG TPA: nuclear transport factor 2 family protein [Dokdonella sp.]|uniref:nuclear transport factor 2 family protein n=1 Tax=Dokdonella sp. TaxID=2291710 RepID=UPI002D7EDA92|nr:nuclear transport factor 2 family protein [Dokdonella sp.]HET9034010.1 nuclear transport factor 2 family protein [Dokdonella sp.]
MSTALEMIQGIYAAFAKGDIPKVLGALARDARWTEAEGGPYGGVYIGPQSVLDNVFMKLGGEWDDFSAVPAEFIANDDVVVALGEYSGTFKATDKSFKAPFAHVWRMQNGKVIAFEQYTDTALHLQPMQ